MDEAIGPERLRPTLLRAEVGDPLAITRGLALTDVGLAHSGLSREVRLPVWRASLNAMAAGQAVRLENLTESNGRWQATVWGASADSPCRGIDCRKTLDLGLAQLARGMAWHDRRAAGQAPQALGQYEHAEFEAKIRRIGLWAGKNPAPPWRWQGR